MSNEISFEQSLYIGNAFAAIFIGIELVLCFQSIYFLLQQKIKRRSTYLYIFISLALLILLVIAGGTNMLFGQFMWIDHRDIPGGPPAYFANNTTVWFAVWGTVASYASAFVGDSLLLYRCYIVLGARRRYIILPGILLLASIALGIVSLIASAKPDSFVLSGTAAAFGTAWLSLSVSFNGLVTAMICARIYYAQRQMRGLALTASMHQYTSVIAMLVESALFYTISGIMWAATFNNTSVSLGFSLVWSGFSAISPQLIILRVAMGLSWTEHTMSTFSVSQEMQFNHSEAVSRNAPADSRFKNQSKPTFASEPSTVTLAAPFSTV